MRLLYGVELDLWMQPQPVEQVRRAALRLADDVEEGQAAQTKQFPPSGVQVLVEVGPQQAAHGLETLCAHSVLVPLVGIRAELTRELLVPAGALDAGQKMARDCRKQLQGRTKQNQTIPRG